MSVDRPQVLDLSAAEVWPGDHVEEGLRVVCTAHYHLPRLVQLVLASPNGHSDQRVLPFDEVVRVVRATQQQGPT